MVFFSRTTLAMIVAQATIGTAVGDLQAKYSFMDKVDSTAKFHALTYKAYESFKTTNKNKEGDDVERRLAGSSAAKWKKKYEECEAELNEESFMYVQMANSCTIKRKNNGKYILTTDDMAEHTWVFGDKPFRSEDEIPTKEFVSSFDDVFADDSPNVAVTFVHEDDGVFDGPLVTAIVKSMKEHEDGSMVVTYVLEQSEEQESVHALNDFLLGEDEVTFEDCSIFIDSSGGQPYCLYGVDTSCFKKGHPKCCYHNAGSKCPKKQPKCEVSQKSAPGYCLFSPDYGCFKGSYGKPSCCLKNNGSGCPKKQPSCDGYCKTKNTSCYLTNGKPSCCSSGSSCPKKKPSCDRLY